MKDIPLAPKTIIFPLAISKLSLKIINIKRNWSFQKYIETFFSISEFRTKKNYKEKFIYIKQNLTIKNLKMLIKGIILYTFYNIFFPFLNSKNAQANIIDYCPRCGFPTYITSEDKNIPTHLETGEWICKNCNARREWNLEKAREQIWNLYKTWFLSINCFDKNKIYLKFIGRYAQALASGLSFIAPIRFYIYYQERIGHLTGNTQVYINAKEAGYFQPRLDLYGYDTNQTVANWYLLDKWFAKLGNSHLVQYVPSAKVFGYHDHEQGACDIYNVTETNGIKPLVFSEEENAIAQAELRNMSIPEGAKIVTLLCRDSKYLSQLQPNIDDSHNDYRNVNISTYKIACEHLAAQDYYVLRMGANQQEKLTWSNKYIIDYASNHRTEFMDVWLFANCDLCMTMGSGPDTISAQQLIPTLCTNFYPPQYCISWRKNYITLFKDIINTKTNTVVPLKELLNPNCYIGRCLDSNKLQKLGYTWRDNTPEEILEATKDMLLLMEGKLILSPEEQARQEDLWDTVKDAVSEYNGVRLHPKELTYHGYFARKYTKDNI